MEDSTNLENVSKKIQALLENRSSLKPLVDRLSDFGFNIELLSDSFADSGSENQVPVNLFLLELDEQSQLEEVKKISDKVKSQFPEIILIGLFSGKLAHPIQEFINQGIDSIFQIPFDEELFLNELFEKIPLKLSNKGLVPELLTRVNILDLETSISLPYDVFVCLPANKKVIPYRLKGHPIEQDTINKFKKLKKYSLYIKKSDIGTYYKQTSDILNDINKNSDLSKEEKTEKLQCEIKQLMGDFFSTKEVNQQDTNEYLGKVRKVISKLEDASGNKSKLMGVVSKLSAQKMTNHSHAQNVATYCSLFGMALGIDEPQSLNMGGLLHDIGLSDLPLELLHKDYDEMTENERAQYKLHPGNARYAIQEKKMELTEDIMKMILQHHEHIDGTGYPYGLSGNEIHPLAKVCAFADVFDKLTSVRFGHSVLSPLEAVMRISGMDGQQPDPIYDENFHGPLINLFLNESENESLSASESENNVSALSASNSKSEDISHGEVEKTNENIVEAGTVEAKKDDPKDSGDVEAKKGEQVSTGEIGAKDREESTGEVITMDEMAERASIGLGNSGMVTVAELMKVSGLPKDLPSESDILANTAEDQHRLIADLRKKLEDHFKSKVA